MDEQLGHQRLVHLLVRVRQRCDHRATRPSLVQLDDDVGDVELEDAAGGDVPAVALPLDPQDVGPHVGREVAVEDPRSRVSCEVRAEEADGVDLGGGRQGEVAVERQVDPAVSLERVGKYERQRCLHHLASPVGGQRDGRADAEGRTRTRHAAMLHLHAGDAQVLVDGDVVSGQSPDLESPRRPGVGLRLDAVDDHGEGAVGQQGVEVVEDGNGQHVLLEDVNCQALSEHVRVHNGRGEDAEELDHRRVLQDLEAAREYDGDGGARRQEVGRGEGDLELGGGPSCRLAHGSSGNDGGRPELGPS
mmetsp:Transcript_2333/g.5451  ORF Transcript_2333/g.5451 Transcript_2333/m.5451 type:complete len:304 (-) Transcript_2333:12843-13754(-)